MDFIVSADTDIGITKKTNQDSTSVKILNTNIGKMAFGILCDGMGGLAKGEVASATVIKEFDRWILEDFSLILDASLTPDAIRTSWCNVIYRVNERIKTYGRTNGIHLGTTAVILLLTQTDYYLLNVGDSRAYEISSQIVQMTEDQSFVAREVAMGRMTLEQAKVDQRRSVLLQCIGASEKVYPDFYTGKVKNNAVYLLCSDGLVHKITSDEIYQKLNPVGMISREVMSKAAADLIETDKQRMESDNITAALIRTY